MVLRRDYNVVYNACSCHDSFVHNIQPGEKTHYPAPYRLETSCDATSLHHNFQLHYHVLRCSDKKLHKSSKLPSKQEVINGRIIRQLTYYFPSHHAPSFEVLPSEEGA